MKRAVFIPFIMISLALNVENNPQKLSIAVENPQEQKMKLLIGLYKSNQLLDQIASIIKEDLSCQLQKKTGFNVSVRTFNDQISKSMLKTIASEDFSLVIVLENKESGYLGLKIIDASQEAVLIAKKIKLSDGESTAHMIADSLWFYLTGQEGIFSTYIAFCKDIHVAGSYPTKNIYYKHPFSSLGNLLVTGGVVLAPRWNNRVNNPLLLYSQVTPSNVRLMSVDMDGKRKIISNFDGLNMLPAYSKDGRHVVYCFTRNGKSQLFDYTYDAARKAKIIRQITTKGNNISPNLLENGDIIFCSDYETGNPHICYYHVDTKIIERLTQGSYCACPSFSEKTNKIVYCKLIKGVMQLCMYDLKTKTEEQITFDNISKDECSWSACGNYLVFSCKDMRDERIALLNLITKEQFFITEANQRCSYPTWSGSYMACA